MCWFGNRLQNCRCLDLRKHLHHPTRKLYLTEVEFWLMPAYLHLQHDTIISAKY